MEAAGGGAGLSGAGEVEEWPGRAVGARVFTAGREGACENTAKEEAQEREGLRKRHQ